MIHKGHDGGPWEGFREEHAQLDLHLRKVTLYAEWKTLWEMGKWGGWRATISGAAGGSVSSDFTTSLLLPTLSVDLQTKGT